MRDDYKLFNLGLTVVIIATVLGGILQIANRVQNRSISRVSRETQQVQQAIAESETRFANLTSREVLRGLVGGIYPNFETLGFNKIVRISDIAIKNDL
ncbi:MAG: hypothetical protein LBO08_00065 [Rickettsiales bacterium]|nr:hypothetical protein [Rickettsiales bacterium]